jgi:hypothetical protein
MRLDDPVKPTGSVWDLRLWCAERPLMMLLLIVTSATGGFRGDPHDDTVQPGLPRIGG